MVIDHSYNLNNAEHIELKREERITKTIIDKECFIILADNRAIGLVLFDYRFFDQGWIELITAAEKYRVKGIDGQAIDFICKQSKTNKIFTSTNSSNTQMQKALHRVGFSFAGKINGLDEGDFELFYFKTPITENEKVWFDRNLYVCKEGSLGLNNNLTLKKHLLDNPKRVIEFSKLKQDLAEKFPNDIDSYVDGKTDFIIGILKKEGIKHSDTKLIENENEKPAHNKGYK